MKIKEIKKEFEDKVFRYITGILGQYCKPLNELTELQQLTLRQDALNLTIVIIKEGLESTISQTRKEGYQSGVNDQAGQYKEYVEEEKKKARQEVIEEMIDDIIKLSSRYWIDRYMGGTTPLIVNKGQFKRFLLEDLNKK